MSGSSDYKIYVYARYAYKCLLANLDDWIEFRNCSHTKRAITHGFYNSVHSLTVPSGLISCAALEKKRKTVDERKTQTEEEKKKDWNPCKDHCYSPQFVARMILDNADTYLTHPWCPFDDMPPNQQKYIDIIRTCCTTIEVTPEENRKLSELTKNDGKGTYLIHVPTDQKYQYLGIELFERHKGNGWYDKPAASVDNYIQTPQELLDYEKQFLAENDGRQI